MKKRWWSILLACAFALTLAQATGFSASALAAPNAHTAAASPSAIDPPYPYQPKCTAATDGAVWKNPTSGITYVCRYVSGVGYQWVPRVVPCSGAVQGSYAEKPAAVVC